MKARDNKKLRPREAMALLKEMEEDVLAAARVATAAGALPNTRGGFLLWQEKQESKLALLEAFRKQLEGRDALDVVAVAEGTA